MPGQEPRGRPAHPGPGGGRRRSFTAYALGSLALFSVAARATVQLDGPRWLAGIFVAVGVCLAAWYLLRQLLSWRAGRRR
jgi:hypothetical protein